MLRVKSKSEAAGSGSKDANHCAMVLPCLIIFEYTETAISSREIKAGGIEPCAIQEPTIQVLTTR